MKSKKITIHEPLFTTDFLVQKGGSVNDLIKDYSKKTGINPMFLEEQAGRMGHTISCSHTKAIGMWLNDKASLGVISHEVFHAVHLTMHKSGVKLNFHTDETFAYYIQFLTDKINDKLFSRSKINKPN